MKMEILIFVAAVVFSVRAIPSNYTCSRLNVKNCTHSETISVPRFHAFLPKGQQENTCSRVQAALQCTADLMKTCSPFETLIFDTQKGVIDMICDSRKQDYIRSEQCFTNLQVQVAIVSKCLSSFPPSQNLKNPCGNLLQAPTCARDVVFSIKGCSEFDASFMQDLMYAFIKPTVDIFKCPVLVDSPSVAPSVTKKPAADEDDLTLRLRPESTSSSDVKVDLRNVMVQTDSKLSYLLNALQPRTEISGLPGCRNGPIVQVNNFIFINSLSPNTNNSSENTL